MKYNFLLIIVFVPFFIMYSAIQESFIVETKKSDKEKKYSELQEDLVCALEEYMQTLTHVLHKVADSQKKSIDELRKVVENMPRMSRERIEKESKRLKQLNKSIELIEFF